MNRNTILLIAAGVAAYLIWKKYGKSSGVGSIIPEGQNLSKAWLKEQSAYQQVQGTYPAMSTGAVSVQSQSARAASAQSQSSGRMDQRFGNAAPSSVPGGGTRMDQRFGNAAYRQSTAPSSAEPTPLDLPAESYAITEFDLDKGVNVETPITLANPLLAAF
jgi:hypothetical protein